jgi:hypothetical protein
MDASTPATPSPDAIRAKRYRDRRRDGAVVVPLHLTGRAVTALREVGFLTAANPTVRDLEVAVMAMLAAAWKAGIRAEGSSPAPDDAARPRGGVHTSSDWLALHQ